MAENEFVTVNPNGADNGPQIGLIAQYVKDLSFENPNAPSVYQWPAQPRIDVSFNIGVAPAADDVHEVQMNIEVRAVGEGEQVAFALELLYAGLFGIRNVAPEQMQGFLYAEAPRLLFPFARRIVAETVRDGNFPPLLLDPIDFAAMYMAQAQQAQSLAGAEPAGEA
ncbi:protein-export chaperone SecB [Sphingomonas nostoxanthinifaciens]|uniref:protein-export chaperone SecB n=1 Tax=Sphingomonas nostoxanthinifaciens TaxID=2872652 RepID=UPI001CC1C734|nr:protein-export chaperone SecB [Sphingomonas nostoxanthinifaciens]UAK24223.1 protein-export chaperone SecB [Sphingomonas nostoxanthinifaciens]